MATTPTIPTPSAPAPSAPASTTPTPAVASPSVQTSTPASTPATPAATPAAVPTEQKSLEQRIAESIQQGFDKTAKGETTETLSSTEAAAAEAAAHVEQTPAGESAVETPAAETPAEEAQPAAAEEDSFEWEQPQAVGPKDLLAAIDAKPELKAQIESNPEFRDLIFANSRLAAKGKAFSEIFASPDEARAVATAHQGFSNVRNLMGNVKPGDVSSTQGVINAMLEMGAYRDEEGNLAKNADGSLQTDGTVGRFLKNYFDMRLQMMESQAKQSGNDELLASLDTLMESAGLRTPSSADEDGMSEQMRARKTELDEQERKIDAEKQAQQKQRQTTHESSVFSKVDTSLDKAIGSILDRSTGLTPFSRKTVEHNLRVGLKKAIAGNAAYQTELDIIERMPLGQNREGKHVALATRYINDHLLTVATPILADAGVALSKRQAADAQSQAARVDAARSEVKGSTAPARPAAPESPEQRNARIRTELTQKLGRTPSLEETLAAIMAPALKRPA